MSEHLIFSLTSRDLIFKDFLILREKNEKIYF